MVKFHLHHYRTLLALTHVSTAKTLRSARTAFRWYCVAEAELVSNVRSRPVTLKMTATVNDFAKVTLFAQPTFVRSAAWVLWSAMA
jgi:hypothetical protein